MSWNSRIRGRTGIVKLSTGTGHFNTSFFYVGPSTGTQSNGWARHGKHATGFQSRRGAVPPTSHPVIDIGRFSAIVVTNRSGRGWANS